MVPRGIHHRADVVEVRGELLDPLADVGVVLVEGGIAEHVGRHEGARGGELTAGPGEEGADGGQARLRVVRLGVPRRRELAVGGKADVVELDLVEALAHRLLGDGDVVVQTSSRKGSTQASFSLSIQGLPVRVSMMAHSGLAWARTLSLKVTMRAMV